MSEYSKLTDQSRNKIKENATKHVKKQRLNGSVVPLSFSSLDKEYSDKFHKIFEDLKTEVPGTTKISAFKEIVDFYIRNKE